MDQTQLNSLYWAEGLSQNQIAQRVGLSQSMIQVLMKKYGITSRSRSEAESGIKNHFYGKRHSDESKTKISLKNSHGRNAFISINEQQAQILDGLLLGDGHLDANNYSARYTHGGKHKEFLDNIKDTLPLGWGPLWFDPKWKCFHMKSHHTPSLSDFHKRWYSHRKKIVPRDIKLTKESLLYWYLSDGSIDFPNKKRFPNSKSFRIKLSTDGFTSEDNQLLVQKLAEIGLESSLTSNRIRLTSSSSRKFLKMIGDTPVECYRYKWGQ